MTNHISRRTILKTGLVAGALIPALGLITSGAEAADLVPLEATDPMAKALNYNADTSKVDDKANPTHKAEQRCDNCMQFKGKAGDAKGGCNIFAGKSVAGAGWCKSWVKKA